MSVILEQGTLVDLPANRRRFKFADIPSLQRADGALSTVTFFGENIRVWFGPMRVIPQARSILTPFMNTGYAIDSEIIAAIGGKISVDVTLAQIYQLMAKQSRGETDALLGNGHGNLFYVRDAIKHRCVIRVRSSGVNWYLDASDLDQGSWVQGLRIFVPALVV